MCSKSLGMGPGTHKIPLELFALNRRRLCDELKRNIRTPPKSCVLLQGGNEISLYNTDVTYVFRQESFFMWTFGVTEPGFYGVIDVETGKSIIFYPKFQQDYEIFMGALPLPEDIKEKYQVDEVYYTDRMVDILKNNNFNVLLILDGTNSDSGLNFEKPQFPEMSNFKLNTEVLYSIMTKLRVYKTDYEIDIMRYVIGISSDAHKQVMRTAKPGQTEYQCESVFLDYCYRVGGCRHVLYTCICGSEKNASILHYGHAAAPNKRTIRDGDMCLFDMGGQYHGYGADITCSFPINGRFTPDQKLIYNAVLTANQAVMSAAKPGVNWVDMHLLASKTMLEALKAGGLLKGNVDDMMKNHLYAVFQPHGLGHLLGLDVHDVGGYLQEQPPRPSEPGVNKLRMARSLEPRMILTIEPGCYFIEKLIQQAKENPKQSAFLVNDVIDRFMNFGGVRIEDDVLITETGCENLTKVPRTIEEIEAWMNKR